MHIEIGRFDKAELLFDKAIDMYAKVQVMPYVFRWLKMGKYLSSFLNGSPIISVDNIINTFEKKKGLIVQDGRLITWQKY